MPKIIKRIYRDKTGALKVEANYSKLHNTSDVELMREMKENREKRRAKKSLRSVLTKLKKLDVYQVDGGCPYVVDENNDCHDKNQQYLLLSDVVDIICEHIKDNKEE